MRATITATIALAAASSASAFVPTSNAFTPRAPVTKVFAEGEKTELVLDTNFDEVNIVKLLGLKSVKKAIRKNKRKKAQES